MPWKCPTRVETHRGQTAAYEALDEALKAQIEGLKIVTRHTCPDYRLDKPVVWPIVTTHPETGMPTYVRIGSIGSDGPGWLGARYQALSPSGQARKNMQLTIKRARLDHRRELLRSLGETRRVVDVVLIHPDVAHHRTLPTLTVDAPRRRCAIDQTRASVV